MFSRTQISAIPKTETPCSTTGCVYNEDGICDEPQVNKGNSDADCFRWSNQKLLAHLQGDEK